MSLFAELKRRNVIRIAGLYLVGAWLLVQVAETVLPLFGIPDWVLRALIVLLALGFVPALVFSWIFELTPDGLRRDSELDRNRSSVDHTARKLNLTVIVLLLAVGAMVLFKPAASPPPPAASAPGQQAIAQAQPGAAGGGEIAGPDPASIAVLPFVDLSQAGDQGYFSDGMAEEILNVLAKVKGLQVASRTLISPSCPSISDWSSAPCNELGEPTQYSAACTCGASADRSNSARAPEMRRWK